MSLPEWVNDDMAWEYSAEEQLKKTLEALSIAVEFIERMAKGNRHHGAMAVSVVQLRTNDFAGSVGLVRNVFSISSNRPERSASRLPASFLPPS